MVEWQVVVCSAIIQMQTPVLGSIQDWYCEQSHYTSQEPSVSLAFIRAIETLTLVSW